MLHKIRRVWSSLDMLAGIRKLDIIATITSDHVLHMKPFTPGSLGRRAPPRFRVWNGRLRVMRRLDLNGGLQTISTFSNANNSRRGLWELTD